MIKAEKLSYGFPEKELYKEISFTLEAGQHCALIGSNGTGKTTLMDLLRRPETYLFDGKLLRENVGRIGYVSQFASREKDQNDTVFAYLSRDFLDLQAAEEAVCAEMETAEELDGLLERYQTLLDEHAAMDADHYEVNIRRQLHLAELEDRADLELSKLSGGEYKLVQVIRQMLRCPGLLMMDEPDVFLDFENLDGLRDLINAYEGTLLVVTHSRYLLNHCFDRIWHLENGDLQEFEGNFREYHFALLQRKIELQEAAAKDVAEIARVSEMVERLRDEATEVIDPAKGRALKAKVTQLGRLQARQIKAPFVALRQPKIHLPEVEPVSAEETEEVLLQVEDYNLSFDKELLRHVSFAVHPGEKVALVGPNGAGKTTLLREIWKNENPAISFAAAARPAFFSQLHEDTLCQDNNLYQEMFDLGFETVSGVESYLSDYCFAPDGLDRKIEVLSGGEKNLLQLAKLSAGNANLLLLDEPSSHLDTDAQLALEKALAAYRGAVLMVSHDFYSIVNCADTILSVEDGTIRPVSGRAFRKRVYKRHFDQTYLELENKKQDLENRVARCLAAYDYVQARALCEELGLVIERM